MKNLLVLVVSLIAVNYSYSQDFNHTLGVNYSQFSGTYGNSDAVGIQYNPQFQRVKGAFIYGICVPLTMFVQVSTARDYASRPVFELPLSMEISFNPKSPCSSYRKLSLFAGAGISRYMAIDRAGRTGTDFINAVAGIRMPPYSLPLELRFNYSRSMTSLAPINRVGISLAVSL